MSVDDILTYFERTTHQFLSKDEFRAKLRSGKPLRVKYGIDVKTSSIHIGHAVNLWLLRSLQDLGHKVVLVFSDYTSRIGDLDGRLATISNIAAEDIEKNISTVIEQAKMILRFDDPDLIEIRRNSEWYSQMGVQDMISLFSLVTHAKLISRDAFQRRIAEGKEIHINEIIYPILQGYDSYMAQSDIAVLGSDHLFNESMGRLLQEKHKKKPQTVIITIVTPGIDGRNKQSQRRHNDVSLSHSPRDKFGRIMSIPDTLTEEYFRIYTDVLPEKIDGIMKKSPRDAKIELAAAIVARYHGADIAQQERDWFDNTISKGYIPDDLPNLILTTDDMETLDLVCLARPNKSKSDSRRLIQQGGIELNGRRLIRPEQELFLKDNDTLQVGRLNWFRIKIEQPPTLYTGRLTIKSVHVRDIPEILKHIPKADVSKYIVRFSNKKKKTEADAKDALKKIILESDPKHEWLWMISSKTDPDKTLGVAYLRGDAWESPQSIWMEPGLVNEEDIVNEAMLELSEYAVFKLDPKSAAFKNAFAIVTAPKSLDALYQSFRIMNTNMLARADIPQGIPGFTREGWEQLQEWRRITSPWLFKDDPRMAFNKTHHPDRTPKPEPEND